MFINKKVDYYLVAIILCITCIDIAVFFFSASLVLPIIWSSCSLLVKGLVCVWNHHHQHCKFFKSAWANRLIELSMGLQTGVVGEAWVLQHTLGHHRNYLDQSADEAAWKTSSGRIMSELEYTLKVSLMAYPCAFKVGRKHSKIYSRMLQNIALTLLFVGVFFWLNWVRTLIIFVAPMLFLLFMTVRETYQHHLGLSQDDPYSASNNIVDRWYNLLTCNLGYHTAHHLQCGRHWSELPELHREIADKIPPSLYREPGFPINLLSKIEHHFTTKASFDS